MQRSAVSAFTCRNCFFAVLGEVKYKISGIGSKSKMKFAKYPHNFPPDFRFNEIFI